MTHRLVISLSGEVDTETDPPYMEIFHKLQLWLEHQSAHGPSLTMPTMIFFAPTIYTQPDGVKRRLRFDKSNNVIDYRPLIDARAFMDSRPQDRAGMLVGSLDAVKHRVASYLNPAKEKDEIRSFLDQLIDRAHEVPVMQ